MKQTPPKMARLYAKRLNAKVTERQATERQATLGQGDIRPSRHKASADIRPSATLGQMEAKCRPSEGRCIYTV